MPTKRSHGATFVTGGRYEVTKRIGQGAFGTLMEAVDREKDERVAIKKVRDAFADVSACRHILREIRLLRHFNHENILSLLDILVPPSDGSAWSDVYIVLERMDVDLHYVLHGGQPVTPLHVQWFMYQLLRGLKAIHSAKCMHRDLKPSNLLVNKNCDLKICDFGLARGIDTNAMCGSPLTTYVVTRWYRAPELLVCNHEYDAKVDLWSVGCILAECISRQVLFKGKDYLQQTRLIIDALGAPPADTLARTVEHPAAAAYISAMPAAPSSPLRERVQPPAGTAADASALDMLGHLLVFDPAARLSAVEALDHAYFASLKDLNDEPSAPPIDLAFEDESLTEAELRRLVWAEMRALHPEVREAPPRAFA